MQGRYSHLKAIDIKTGTVPATQIGPCVVVVSVEFTMADMSGVLTCKRENEETSTDNQAGPSEFLAHSLLSLRDAALNVLREVDAHRIDRESRFGGNLSLHEAVQRYEIDLIRDALKRTRGNQRRAARLLGVKVTTLHCKIKRFGISLTES